MRGTLTTKAGNAMKLRIIPAHAGNSYSPPQCATRHPDHPRACGELGGGIIGRGHSTGSSPRMRGTPVPPDPPSSESRIIPAHAGNSPETRPTTTAQSDHPRACGELGDAIGTVSAGDGSSPRMRGTRLSTSNGGTWTRIIPAHAGNSTTPAPEPRGRPDHPRACGELRDARLLNRPNSGSSPRMRGTPETDVLARILGRIIPAHAGNSLDSTDSRMDDPDHPRACGELPARKRKF